jgi:hypothetical protein
VLAPCDTRDPFSAFQKLRSLLEDISPNSPKKQLSIAEQRASLRLLDIIEPFLSSTPSQKNLISQPTEILDEIAFHVETESDLLAFALSCLRMYRVITPRHLEYRLVRAKISSVEVWKHLIDNEPLARGIRRLEVLDARSTEQEIFPFSVVSDVKVEIDPLNIHEQREALFIKALSSLTALTNFVWGSSHSPINMEHLWDLLVRCEYLKVVEIMNSQLFTGESKDRSMSVSWVSANLGASLQIV